MILLGLAAVTLAACGDNEQPPPPRATLPSVTSGVDSPVLAGLLVEHWDLEAAIDPLTATFLGDHRFDNALPPIRRDEVLDVRARRTALLARITAVDTTSFSPHDRITYGVLVERLTAETGLDVCDYERWAISTRDSMISRLDSIGGNYAWLTPEDAEGYLARVTAMPAAIDAYAAELAAGAAAGEVNHQAALLTMIDQIRFWADRPASQWPMVTPFNDNSLGDDSDRLHDAVISVITNELAPAYGRLATTLATSVLPAARAIPGLAGLPDGTACYAAEIRHHTTEPLTAADLHALGLSEVARIEAAMLALGHEIYGVDTLDAIRTRLHADTAQSFHSEAEIVNWASGTIARASERVTPLFARLPTRPPEIVPYPASYGQIAAGYQPSPDGIQPGRFYLVTQPPELQSRWDLESTTYHESIPGHHLQLSRAAELTDLPLLRRWFGDTAYIEGWGLYAETLAGEIDLYTDGPARLGRLSNEALRACRLVIDTGLHDLGWTRDEANAYMTQHTLYTGEYVFSEIERYIDWPGQALAYKVGELEILRIRSALGAREGASFSLRDFHEAVLSEGSLPLPVLAEHLLGSGAADLRPQLVELQAQGH